MKRPLAIDLFGCGGGMTLAMLMAGFRVPTSVDKEPRWAEAIRVNFCGADRLLPAFPEVRPLTKDLLRTTPQQIAAEAEISLGDVSWVHLSPPCNDHSYAGFRIRYGEGHNCLLVPKAWADACPTAYVTVENVTGVEDSEQFAELLKCLREHRETCWQTVCASWYGVPQQRRRVWIVSAPAGMRCPPLPPPTVPYGQPRPWEWAMRHPRDIEIVDDFRFPIPSAYQREVLPTVPEGGTSRNITHPPTKQWIDDNYGRVTNFIRRLRRDHPVPAVMTGVKIMNFLLYCHPWLNRPSTVREMARFQDLPDEFVLPPSLSAAYRLIGEAVPIGMGLGWAERIMRALGHAYKLSDGGILLPSRPDLISAFDVNSARTHRPPPEKALDV